MGGFSGKMGTRKDGKCGKGKSKGKKKGSKGKKGKKVKKVFIVTDIGHDWDDGIAIMHSLTHHKEGKLKIVGILCVSGNNKQRADQVLYLLSLYDVKDVPVYYDLGQGYVSGDKQRPLQNVEHLESYVLDPEGKKYEYTPEESESRKNFLKWVDDNEIKPILVEPGRNEQEIARLFKSHSKVTMLVIGPAVQVELIHAIKPNTIECVVFQGLPLDEKSFNMGCDMKSHNELFCYFANHKIPMRFIGKAVAYATRMRIDQLPKSLWLFMCVGAKEFRDANPELFATITPPPCCYLRNIGFGPGKIRWTKPILGSSDHPSPKCLGNEPSTLLEVYESNEYTGPLYDLTCVFSLGLDRKVVYKFEKVEVTCNGVKAIVEVAGTEGVDFLAITKEEYQRLITESFNKIDVSIA